LGAPVRPVHWTILAAYLGDSPKRAGGGAVACRFYARRGCELRGLHRGMDPEFPDEVQLLWYTDL
jgi:hypothetical protein